MVAVAIRVKCDLTEAGAVGGDDTDVGTGDEQERLAVAMGGADRDVAELAQVAQGDPADGVNAVVANPVVGRCHSLCAPGLEAGVEGQLRGSAWRGLDGVGVRRRPDEGGEANGILDGAKHPSAPVKGPPGILSLTRSAALAA